MKSLSTFNKLFLIFCAVVIAFLAYNVPHESQESPAAEDTVLFSE